MANVTIDLAAEYRGRPAFTKAGKDVSALEKSVQKLGKQFIGLFAARKVMAFGKATAQAFMEDQKSAAILANTVKNLGLAFAQPEINDYIKNLETASGVVDEQLRPALQKLLTTTGNVRQSQELLNQAIEISRGSGIDLATVTQDLTNAYVGNTKGLKKYNLGLTAAQLKAASFTDIQKKLNDQFSGSSAAYLKTYAGKLEVLNTAADNAKETIGKGLIDALVLLGKDTNITNVSKQMNDFATYTSNAIVGLADLTSKLNNLKLPSWFANFAKTVSGGAITPILNALSKRGEKLQNAKLQNPSVAMFLADEAKKTAAIQLKVSNTQIKAAKALTAEQKKQAALKKAGTVFDLEQIQLIAALKGKLSDDEKKRVEAQLALLNGNDAVATKLKAKL